MDTSNTIMHHYLSTQTTTTDTTIIGNSMYVTSFLLHCTDESRSFYSIGVHILDTKHSRADTEIVWDITNDPILAQDYYERIRDGNVTPTTLKDVMENLLA